jgi:hypothetical protein
LNKGTTSENLSRSGNTPVERILLKIKVRGDIMNVAPIFKILDESANETKRFKNTLKKLLMDNSFYSVDEFINFRE